MESVTQEIGDSPISLPPYVCRPDHQLSGHVFGKGKTKFGILKDLQTHRILKPIIDKRGPREYEFYKAVWEGEKNQMQSFVPRFYGLVTIDKVSFIQIEDVLEEIVNPSSADIKIGRITYDPEATWEKREEEMKKSPWQKQVGFRICGMRIYNSANEGNYITGDRTELRNIRPEHLTDKFDFFLGSPSKPAKSRMDLCEGYLDRLTSIHHWFDKVNINNLKFLSSSLLLIHSHDNQTIKVRMIDFGHVFPNLPSPSQTTGQPQKLRDENYLYGLNRLIAHFTGLHARLKDQTQIPTQHDDEQNSL